MTGMTLKVLEDLKLSNKVASRCKNFFALGLCSWLYSRPIDPTLKWIQDKFKKTPELVEANARVLKAGYHYGETTELFASSTR
jgi:2-oxoglutarate ferredoxin oxidoreductase subunit alpha